MRKNATFNTFESSFATLTLAEIWKNWRRWISDNVHFAIPVLFHFQFLDVRIYLASGQIKSFKTEETKFRTLRDSPRSFQSGQCEVCRESRRLKSRGVGLRTYGEAAAGKSEKPLRPRVKFLKMIPCPGKNFLKHCLALEFLRTTLCSA